MTARYLSKKALKLTDAEKTQTFENFVRGRSRQGLTETCLRHLGPSLNHPRSWFSLTILFDPRWLQENRDISTHHFSLSSIFCWYSNHKGVKCYFFKKNIILLNFTKKSPFWFYLFMFLILISSYLFPTFSYFFLLFPIFSYWFLRFPIQW